MNKKLYIAIVVTVLSLSFSSCKKNNDNEDKLNGLYLTEACDWDGIHQTCKALNFIDENTVLVYSTVINYEHWKNEYAGNFSVYLGTGFWYYQRDCDFPATYSIIENTIYIPSEGMTFNIDGDKLYSEGGDDIYTKATQQGKPVSMKGKTLKFVKDWNEGIGTHYTSTATFDFTDDVSCNYTMFHIIEFDGSVLGDPASSTVETDEYKCLEAYTCTNDRIDIDNGWIVLVKVNGEWQWEGHPDFILQ